MAEPKRVCLTEDFVDLLAGVGFPQGTILIRSSSGQYITEGMSLGEGCVTGFWLIRDICVPVEDGA